MAEGILEHFDKTPVVGVLRGIDFDLVNPVITTAIESGLKTIELTSNTPEIEKLLTHAAKEFGDDIDLGCGTVLSVEQAQRAVAAGARFIVAPTYSAEVADWCAGKEIPHIPGAMTPTEIEHAWKSKPYMVKIFPAQVLGGPEYIEQLRSPFDKKGVNPIKLMVSGGIRVDNIGDYFRAGVDTVCVGGTIFNPQVLAQGDWKKLGNAITKIVKETESAADQVEQ